MSKFQPPMLNDDACRVSTDKQTHKHTHTHTHKHTYRVKTEETFFYGQIFYFLFFLLYLFESIKRRFPINAYTSIAWYMHIRFLRKYMISTICQHFQIDDITVRSTQSNCTQYFPVGHSFNLIYCLP